MTYIDAHTAQLLELEAARINSPAFIDKDPVQFPRRFESLPDIEICSLLASTIAWGNRKMICRDIEKMLLLMDHQPHAFLMEGAFEQLDPQMNLHRTFFASHLQWLMRGLRKIYSQYPTLDAFAASILSPADPAPAWTLADALRRICEDENNGLKCSRTAIPTQVKTTALKRLNMMLRWLVRNDGIVDMGVWQSITPAQLYLPLDVHVGNTARQLDILKRRSNDRRAVEELTATLRTLSPHDPCLYDYALFGIGVGE